MESKSNSSVADVLSKHAKFLDDDDSVKEYVLSLLQDDDVYSDPQQLRDTLNNFIDADVDVLVKELMQLHEGTVAVQEPENSVANAPTRRLRNEPIKLGTLNEQSSVKEETFASSSPDKTKSKKKPHTKRRHRKEQQQEQQRLKGAAATAATDSTQDDASTWQECIEQGSTWGGRGKGGRGEYAAAVNSIKSNIHLSNVSISLPNGRELLQNTTMDIVRGHKYGLIGRNGVGKSTLLCRLAQKAIPGMPLDMRVLLVQQQMEGSDEESALNVLVQADVDREYLLREQQEIEDRMESDDVSEEELASLAERLGDVIAELDVIDADTAEERALEILKGLQFTHDMIHGPTKNLSGGWRMRLALARALFGTCANSDLLLVDECTNHLDLYGTEWVIQYLQKAVDKTLIVVSHDRSFLDAICTDIVVMEHQKLKYHVGNYSEYERQQQEKAAREAQILDAAERQQTKAQAFVQKQQAAANRKSADPNKQRQAKMIREKKMDRIGNYREDGKRYKLKSLKKLSEDYVRLAQKVEIEADEPIVKILFPNPIWPPGITIDSPIVRLEDFTFGYRKDRPLIKNVTLSLNRGTKAALVGRNGIGKSTLASLIAGDLELNDNSLLRGQLWRHPSLRIGHVTQYSVEELDSYASETVVEYAETKLRSCQATASVISKAAGNIRQYLGAFGLGGKHALQPIGKLSGGERMRLCFATVLAEQPHLLLLDESTNHVDLETLDAMSQALNAYEGSVLMVSHNQGFLSGFCKELWVLEDAKVTVTHSDTETFDEIFSEYRNSIARDARSLTRRREKADMAKRATKQRTGVRQNVALL